MNKLTLFCFPFFLMMMFASHGQDIGRYHFEEFDLAHKAGVPGVYSMFQDTTGVIWFGSTNGIYRYDGSRIFEFDAQQKKLLGKTNYSFLQDKNGDVIIGSDFGICRYSPKHNSIKLLVHLGRVFNDRCRYYPVCFGDNGSLWFVASGKGVGVYSGGGITWMENPPEIPAESVYKVSDAFYNHKTGEVFMANYLSTKTIIFNIRTHAFRIDSLHATVSFAKSENDLYRVHSKNILKVNLTSGEKNIFLPERNLLFADNILYSRSVIRDDQWLWVSLRDGILPFNYRQGKFGEPFGYDGDTKCALLRHISEVFKDKEGNIWICTETNGIKLLNQSHLRKFQHLSDFNSSNNIVMDIEPVNDSLLLVCPLVETPRIVNILNNSQRDLLSKTSAGSSSFSATRISNSTILLLNHTGNLYSFNTTSLLLSKPTIPIADILKIIATPKSDELIICNSKELFLCTYVNGQIKVGKSIPLGFPVESIIYNPYAGLIYCSTQEKFIRIDLKTLTTQHSQKPFSGSFMDYTWSKDKTLWLATRSGLQHYDNQNQLIGSINTTNGLNNDVVYAIRPNHDSTLLFLSTNLGISCYFIASKKTMNFTLADGLLESEHNGAASAADVNGNYYFGNIKGISVFNESLINQMAVKPFLIVQGIYVDDAAYSALNSNFIEQIDLYPDNAVFGINYSLLSTSEPGKLVYSYKIEGIDHNFHRSNTATAIRISKPSPGKYTIILKGEVEGGSIVEKRIRLIVHAPYYLKWWFLLPAILLFHLGIFIVVRQIIRNRLQKKQQEIDSQRLLYEQKSQIARELHDNVGARLSMMLNTVDWIGKKPQIEAHDLNEIKENTKAVIQGLRDAIWVMDKTQITVEELFDKIKYYSHQISRNYSIDISFNEVTHQPVNLNTTQALNLFRIFQESLNNALKYSEATQVEISVNYEGENEIILKIQDNGKGFDLNSVFSGHGLKNMQVRAEEINALFALQSTKYEGTNIIVTLYIV